MKRKIFRNFSPGLAALLVALALAAPSFAVDLAVVVATATMPDGATIPMWGYVLDTNPSGPCPTPGSWEVGPTLTATDGGTLTISLRNCLSEAVSLFIPGQYKALDPVWDDGSTGPRPDLAARVRSLDAETAPGAVGFYEWSGVKAGTYLYHSGTHQQVQVQMGLYGALVVGSYPTVDQEEVLLYSEIDPALHDAVDDATYGTAAYPSTFDYQPKYFLINGRAYPDTTDVSLATSEEVLIRFVNAGLKTHAPTLDGGVYMRQIAEDGNLYPYPREEYSVALAAGKTIDALVNVGEAGRYALYDRDLHLTNWNQTGGGMLTYLDAGAAGGAPTAVDDAYTVAEGVSLVVNALDDPIPLVGVLDNDTGAGGPGLLEAFLASSPSAGTLECIGGDHPVLCADGSFTYTPNGDFNGTDIFSYVANDGGADSNVASVRITVTPVNDAPVAVDDAYDAVEGQTLSVAALGVLENDIDIDSGSLEAVLDSYGGPGTLTLNLDGSFEYTPHPSTGTGGTDSFTYLAHDGTDSSALAATVTITVIAAPDNLPPFANDDFA
ncbi:MAG: Ig-like domain-containing protein, partial [Thermoanaerobaculia bacterium]